ncbi:hypothetical protein [Neptunomonas phycophila]|uniref:hypothetical protein n=1 Tax=Neptunomonas phycophila TaxID=1572645 RepID=UPI003510EEC3
MSTQHSTRTALSSSLIKTLLATAGWTKKRLAARWELTERRINQIIADKDRPCYYDEAFLFLKETTSQDTHQQETLSVQAIKELIKGKGWQGKQIAQRWGMTERRISQIVTNPERAPYYNDGFRGLPSQQP